MSPWAIKRLGKAILQGAIIAYPTDTIWGLGCHPQLAHSVSRILDIKQRPVEKGLILLGSSLDLFEPYISDDLTVEQAALLTETTGRPVTWLVPASDHCPTWIRGHFPNVAIRITNHPFVAKICEQILSPIVSTSANRAGGATVRNVRLARRHFIEQVDFIVSGFDLGTRCASEIKSLESGHTIRAQRQ
ncbi:MAG: L-threonylcarbamoyladenylate synthase [Proteobacteria bacterium]|nr:L-threonylcarbamoyladenylate synthase [Pseudomonadota bacterium]